MKNFFLHAFSVSFLLGNTFAQYRSLEYRTCIVLVLLFIATLIFIISSKSFHKVFITALIFFIGYFISTADINKIQCIRHLVKNKIYLSEHLSLRGKIEKVVESDQKITYFAKTEIGEFSQTCGVSNVGFYFTDREAPTLSAGDRFSVTGELREIRPFKTDTGRWFDYSSFLSVDEIYFEVVGRVVPESVSSGSTAWGLYGLRSYLLKKIDSLFEAPVSALVGGILLGEKRALGKALNEAFQKTGLTHIVVLSGANVSIILQTVMFFLVGFSRRYRLLLSLLAVFSFLLLVGISPTTLRASIMASVSCFATFFRRRYGVSSALFLSAAFMVALSPRILSSSPGFHLSFLATFALTFILPKLENSAFALYLYGIKGIFLSTVATQLVTLPYMVSVIGLVSLVGVVPNILVLPIIPFAMLLSFVGIVFGSIHFWIGSPFILGATVLLEYSLLVVNWFATLPFSAVKAPTLSELVLLIPYTVLICLFFLELYRDVARAKLFSITAQLRLVKKSST